MLRVLAVVVVLLGCNGLPHEEQLEQRLSTLRKASDATRRSFDLSSRHRAAIIGAVYDSMFGGENTHTTHESSTELGARYEAAQLTAFYTLEPRHVHEVERAVTALDEQQRARTAHYVELFRLLAETRQFERANQFAERARRPTIPRFIDESRGQRPSMLVDDESRHAIVRRGVDLRTSQIVVVASPGCHFSKDAMLAIARDATLNALFRKHATYIAPPDTGLDITHMRTWNNEHPEMAGGWAYRREEWPMIEHWATPTFLFIRDGIVVTKVNGWPDDSRREDLRAAALQLGL